MPTVPDTAAPVAAVPRRRFLRSSIAAVVLLALAGGAGYGWWKTWGGGAPRPDENIYATVQRGDIEDLVGATGSLQPRDYVDVGAQVSGQLKKIHVEVGSEVREGELLAEIDAEQSAARVDANRAQLRAQQATLLERQETLAKAERDLQRQKNLAAEEATTAETLQNAETAVRTARTQITALKAQIEQGQASMRVEEANLKYTKIYAPMAGTVVSVAARQGQTLNTNQSAPTVLRIADLSTMTVQTQVGEADVGKLRGGMQAYFTTLGGQGRRWYGALRKLEPTPTVTNNVVLYNALFDVPNSNRALMPQMTAQVFFVAGEARDVLMVPMSALSFKRGPGAGGRRDRGAAAAGAASGAASGADADGGAGGGAGGGAPRAAAPASGVTPRSAGSGPRADAGGGAKSSDAAGRVPAVAKAGGATVAADPGRSAIVGGSALPTVSARAAALRSLPSPVSVQVPFDAIVTVQAGSADAAARPARPASGAGPRFDRAAWESMTEEQRERFRAERRAAREAAGGSPNGDRGPRPEGGFGPRPEGPPGARPDGGAVARPGDRGTGADADRRGARAGEGRPGADGGERRPAFGDGGPRGTGEARAARPAGAASGSGWRGDGPRGAEGGERRSRDGAAGGQSPNARGPRRATVKVATADGTIVEREVVVGISNRVHAEILSGLQEGERIVAGVKVPDAPPRRNTNAQQGGLGQPGGMGGPGGPGGMPGGMGGGTGGGRR